ncbi:MAG: beta-propeller fold lactonase family protein [Alphaproteobacteria bacterium]|nr:beta-propeller fold lactonase family protein [Alphaproteobacteria bacterium]
MVRVDQDDPVAQPHDNLLQLTAIGTLSRDCLAHVCSARISRNRLYQFDDLSGSDTTSATGRGANYVAGSVGVVPIEQDGSLGVRTDLGSLPGEPRPNRKEQARSHPHECPFDRAGRFILAPDKSGARERLASACSGPLSAAFRADALVSRQSSGALPAVLAREERGQKSPKFCRGRTSVNERRLTPF